MWIVTVLALFSFTLNFAFAKKSIKDFEVFTLESDLNKIEIGQNEILFAETIHRANTEIKKDKIDLAPLKKIQKNFNPHFVDYKPFIDYLVVLKKTNTIKSCINILKKEQNNQFLLKQNIEKFCHRHLFKKFNSIVKGDFTRFLNFQWYLENYLSYFVSQRRFKKFISYLNQVKDKKRKTYLKQSITQYYLQNNFAPREDLKNFLTINGKMFKLIENNKEKYLKYDLVWRNFFVKNIRAAYALPESKEKGDKIKKISQSVNNVLVNTNGTMNKDFVYDKILPFTLYLIRNKLYFQSRILLNTLNKKYPYGEKNRNDYIFSYLWSYVANNQYKSAFNYITKKNLLDDFDQLESRNQYWISIALSKLKKNKTADTYLKRLIKTHPISFYSIMARERLELKMSGRKISSLTKNLYTKSSGALNITINSNLYSKIVRTKAWLSIKSFPLLNYEINNITRAYDDFINTIEVKNRKNHISQFHYSLSKLCQDNFNYLVSFKVIYAGLEKQKLSLDYRFLKLLFPAPYLNLIAGLEHKIDPILLLSLIRQESSFNPYARSRVGALGLMQLMPKTAKRMSRRYKKSDLTNPIINMSLGTKYLSLLLKRYQNNILYTLSAYNAGERNIDSWSQEYFHNQSFLKNLETIPFRETKKYVKLIYRNMYFYNKINSIEKGIFSKKSTSRYLGFKR
jgi:soluble lytic murein transglycosylase